MSVLSSVACVGSEVSEGILAHLRLAVEHATRSLDTQAASVAHYALATELTQRVTHVEPEAM
jgi:hypothetical protein